MSRLRASDRLRLGPTTSTMGSPKLRLPLWSKLTGSSGIALLVISLCASSCGPKPSPVIATDYSVGVAVSGLAMGTSFTITDTDNSASAVINSNSAFTVDSSLASGKPFNLTFTSPSGQACAFASPNSGTTATGTVGSSNVTLSITCTSSNTPISLNGPYGLVFDATYSNLYVANSGGNQVLIYNETGASSGKPILTQTGSITIGISDPSRLAFDAAGYLYVANMGSNTVTVYNPSSSLNTVVATMSGLSRPLGIAVDQGGRVYVANNGANTVSVYSPVGSSPSGGFTLSTTLSQDAKGNQFLAPEALMFSGSNSNGALNALFVGLGGSSNAVLLYETPLSASFAPQGSLTNNSCPTGPNGPTALATNGASGTGSSGATVPVLIYASNYNANSVSSWYLTSIMTGGCPALTTTSGSSSQIAQPQGVAVDGFGNVFVANSSSNTITAYSSIATAPVLTQH